MDELDPIYLRMQELHRERRRRLAGWAFALVITAIMWWGIIAALRWAV